MIPPTVPERVEFFLAAIADRCKTCIVKGRCDSCLSMDAKRLLIDWRLWKVQNAAATVQSASILTKAEESIIVQLSDGRWLRADKILFPYGVSYREKMSIFRRMVDRNLIVCHKRMMNGRERNFYGLPGTEG